jgi:SAM-dependent methyltransferase
MDQALYREHAQLERDHWWFVGRRAIVERVLASTLPAAPDRRILDVGCGTGGMLPMLAGFGHVEGLEPEQVAVDHCRTAFPDYEVRQGRVPDEVPSDGSFDLVTAFDVVEHIADDREATERLRAAVRPGGHVAVTVPALMQLWSDHDVRNGHHRRYTRPELAELLVTTGLDLRHVSYFNTALLPVVASARLAQRLRRRAPEHHSDFSMPSPRVNRLLTGLFRSERSLVARPGLPIGVSLIAVAQRR